MMRTATFWLPAHAYCLVWRSNGQHVCCLAFTHHLCALPPVGGADRLFFGRTYVIGQHRDRGIRPFGALPAAADEVVPSAADHELERRHLSCVPAGPPVALDAD